tara:strand:- start:3958 stop:5103 length:1146 start_codon:yes stop_codon:yes gene_type:complete
MLLVTIILGTRPEAIKLAPVIIKFAKSNYFKVRLILTGQHKEMVSQVLDLFQLKADKDLNLMTRNQTLTHITSNSLIGLNKEFKDFRPDLVIVQGDTSTAFSASLAAFYEKIPIAHVEAGLRTSNFLSPFPEEANRRFISQIASLHFAPTELAEKNLQTCGISKNVFVTGNTVVDSLMIIASRAKKPKILNLDWVRNRLILVTIHRRENWGVNLKAITAAIKEISRKRQDITFLIPMHKNEIVRETIVTSLSNTPNIFLTEPFNYAEQIGVLKECYLIITDSGGLQEEAPTFGKPVLILRDNTERKEALQAGSAKLIGTNQTNIINEIDKILDNKHLYEKMTPTYNPFGDGKSSGRIFNHCYKYLKDKQPNNRISEIKKFI